MSTDTSSKKFPQGLLWMDLEMTGLSPETDFILEIAAVVTDFSFQPLSQFETVIYQPQEILLKMDEWNQKHHSESGLLAKVPKGQTLSEAETYLTEWMIKNHPADWGKPILAGNSIHQDRAFLQKHLPQFVSKLHYRQMDVSSWKIIMQGKYQKEFKKQNKHRAIEDIYESIAELKFYLNQRFH